MKTANFNLFFPIIEARAKSFDPEEGVADFLFILDGEPAYAIEQAEHASFYGIHALHRPEAARAARIIYDAVADFLIANKITCYSYSIISAHSVNTDGTPTPYRAETCVRLDIKPAPRES